MARAASLFSLSLLLCLTPLVAGYSISTLLETKVPLAGDGHSDGGASNGRELYYFSLKHRDAPNSPFLQRYSSRHELLQTVLQRDEERAKSFLEHIVQRRARQATGMVTEKGFVAMDSGSPPDPRSQQTGDAGVLLPPAGAGEYYTELYVGTPRQLQVAMVDLGSDVVWLGEAPSRLQKRRIDGDAVNSHFYPSSSSSFTPIPARSEPCLTVDGIHVCGNGKSCRVLVGTEDHYTGALEFAYEDIRLNRTHHHKGSEMANIMITISKTPIPTGGVLGLGLGKTSFATQMGSNHIANKFAYCLSDTDEPSGSSLVFNAGEDDPNLEFTPLVTHPHITTFHFVNLIAITVNNIKLPIPSKVLQLHNQGEGGTIIDMSTRFSRFPKSAFHHIMKAFKSHIDLPTILVPGFHLCYSMANSDILRVPSLTLVFQNNARMRLPMENLFVSASEQGDVMCLAMVPTSPGTPTVIGSTQQQNFLMVVDRGRSRVGFAPRQCASLPNL
ncbi:hypothetical protein M758_7G079900 [Ceratodon purpureus]|nr:hypothetical protein M758_7G079900 [Ceratodon purpureus]